MKNAIAPIQMLVRLAGVILVVLGVLFWAGHALTLIPVHKQVGYVFVLLFWTLAVLAGRGGVNRGFVTFALLWGLLVPVLGVAQDRLLPGDVHWLIKVLHLILGLVAMGLAERLAARVKHDQRPAVPA